MPNINKAQAEALKGGLLDSIGDDRGSFEPVRLEITAKVLAQYGAEFKLALADLINKRQLVGKGDLADKITPEVVQAPGVTKLQVRVLDYYDFVNEGVRGVNSSKNAPGSPYKFKNFGMNQEGRKSIKDYIQSGLSKVRNTEGDKARGIGLERKGVSFKKKKSIIDKQVDSMIWGIKAFGIKRTNYFNDAFKEVFKDFGIVMSEAVGRDVVFTLEKLNRK